MVAAKAWPRGPGAHDQHVALVATACTWLTERQAQDGAGDERDDVLGREEQHQEETADVRQLEPEEHRERGHGHEHGRTDQVPGLRADRPARARPVHAVEREGHDPAYGVEEEQGLRVGDDLPPPDGPVLAEAQRETAAASTTAASRPSVSISRARRAEDVAPDHVRVTLRRSGAFWQWYVGSSAVRGGSPCCYAATGRAYSTSVSEQRHGTPRGSSCRGRSRR